MSTIEVKVPDIGDFTDIPVIEIFVKPGDSVKAEDSLVTLESDKATMDVPSPAAGTIKEIKVKLGDKVSEGSPIVVVETGAAPAEGAPKGGQRGKWKLWGGRPLRHRLPRRRKPRRRPHRLRRPRRRSPQHRPRRHRSTTPLSRRRTPRRR